MLLSKLRSLKVGRLIPLVLAPYVLLGAMIAFLFLTGSHPGSLKVIGLIVAAMETAAFLSTVWSTADSCSPTVAASRNLFVKCCHIPAYIVHFCIGLWGMLLSVWGIGFILYAFLADVLTIVLSGIPAAACAVRMYKGDLLSKKAAILTGIGSFIFCADIICALYFVLRCGSESKVLRRLFRQAAEKTASVSEETVV